MNTSSVNLQLFALNSQWPGDPRTESWPLMQNPYPSILLSLLYLLGVKVGMDLMKDRKPMNVKVPLIWYNFILVLLNLWIFIESGITGWFGKYNVFCQPVPQEASEINIRMAFSGWVFFMSKFIEFADTGFFIVRKRNDLVTRLHVIHHSIIPTSSWTTVKYTPGELSTHIQMLLKMFLFLLLLFFFFLLFRSMIFLTNIFFFIIQLVTVHSWDSQTVLFMC